MIFSRLIHTIKMCFIRDGYNRANYLRKKKIFAYVGLNVTFQPRIIPLYSNLIKLHNNVHIASGVTFITHDIIHIMCNNLGLEHRFKEAVGCIEIFDNCFIGSNTTILYNVAIGPNVIVAANSVVVKNCEPNSVYAGVPAVKVGDFNTFVNNRIEKEEKNKMATVSINQHMRNEEMLLAWDLFYKANEPHMRDLM